MNVEDAETKLKDYLLYGIAAEIYFADEAYGVVEEIGKHVHEIRANGLGLIFGSLQTVMSDRQTLSVTKLFDPPNRRYPTRSIPVTLNFLADHADLWEVPQYHQLHDTLIAAGVDSEAVKLLSNAELTKAIVAHHRNELVRLSPALSAVRQSRDKIIAHNEAVDRSTLHTPTWGGTLSLVAYAKDFVSSIGFAYLSTFFGQGSYNYHLTYEAQRTARNLRELLRKADILDEEGLA